MAYCNIHGPFEIIANNLANGEGCPLCQKENIANKKRYTCDEWINKAKNKRGNTNFDFSETKYIDSKHKIKIKCKKCGNFFDVWPSQFMYGSGCPKCRKSHLEDEIEIFLIQNKITFEYQKRFNWLGKQSLDFFIPRFNIAIECQGSQHFFKGHFRDSFDVIKKRDLKKKELCEKNGVTLIYYSNLNIKYPYLVIEDKKQLLNLIS